HGRRGRVEQRVHSEIGPEHSTDPEEGMSPQSDRGPSRRFLVSGKPDRQAGRKGMVSVPANRGSGRNDKSSDRRMGQGSDPGGRKTTRAGHRYAKSGNHRGERASRRVREGSQSPHPELPRVTRESSQEADEMARRSGSRE